MKTRNCEVMRFGNEDWFRLDRLNKSSVKIDHYLEQINFDEWHIYKKSNRFKKVSKKEVYAFDFSGYIFFNKKLYNDAEIDEWIEFYHEDLKLGCSGGSFLSKPFPPIYIKNKIRIKQ
jgi:hypothetical protein